MVGLLGLNDRAFTSTVSSSNQPLQTCYYSRTNRIAKRGIFFFFQLLPLVVAPADLPSPFPLSPHLLIRYVLLVDGKYCLFRGQRFQTALVSTHLKFVLSMTLSTK